VATGLTDGPALRRQPVLIGISDGTFTEVIAESGLLAGERVAVGEWVQASTSQSKAGNFRLRLF
jgi:transcriptional regulator GlxA family with amidase domain